MYAMPEHVSGISAVRQPMYDVSSTKKSEKRKAEMYTRMEAIIPSISASSMMASRLDITQIFGDLDDFYLQWSQLWREQKQLPSMPNEKRCRSRMSLSEVMTISCCFLILSNSR